LSLRGFGRTAAPDALVVLGGDAPEELAPLLASGTAPD
jgi:hypothetical protein